MTELIERKICSRCFGEWSLKDHYEINKKGEYFKTCNLCRKQYRELYERKRQEEIERIGQWSKERVICEVCGTEVCRGGLKAHQKTNKCRRYLQAQQAGKRGTLREEDDEDEDGGLLT